MYLERRKTSSGYMISRTGLDVVWLEFQGWPLSALVMTHWLDKLLPKQL